MSYKINAYVEPHYPIKKSLLVSSATAALNVTNIKGKVEASISVIGDRKMRQLNREYRGIDEPTDVLAFPYALDTGGVGNFVAPPSKYLNLGDVAISYPQLIGRAVKEEVLVDEMASILTIHGVLHLLGMVHEREVDAAKMEELESDAFEAAKV